MDTIGLIWQGKCRVKKIWGNSGTLAQDKATTTTFSLEFDSTVVCSIMVGFVVRPKPLATLIDYGKKKGNA